MHIYLQAWDVQLFVQFRSRFWQNTEKINRFDDHRC